ncbi:TPA_asm: hypothetical protein HUJ06_032072 [Nelumbo nucifera]|uniref:Uncharacterized protein n=1 Tax=Nelumbo nucifera TaxID=4432 RepID=A0A823A131_NELNU|nr:TPA_asm: hypothetical protein HUJ06_000039 [Nelumbo nucifera]DAD49471.1 TPA_asm: hypothetical protein HUJ06_032072 [Nelumbo nucifera]
MMTNQESWGKLLLQFLFTSA